MTLSLHAGERAGFASEPPPARRLEYIDGLRAAAALWVAFHHALETSTPTTTLGLPVVGPVLASLAHGQFPVMIFLMLSGFCLYYPYVKRNPQDPKFYTGFLPYMRRRATRIAPPYLCAGLFCLAMALFPDLQIGRWKQVVPIDASVIASHLLFIHNLIPSHSIKIDYPMWSIGLEWQLYLLFPLLVLAFRRTNGWVVTGVCFVIAAVAHVVFRRLPQGLDSVVREGPLAYLEIFAAGMVAAAMTVRRTPLPPRWLLALVAAGGLLAVRLGSGNGFLHDLETSAAAFSILLLATDPRGAVSRALSTPWLVRVGVFSYSLYLMHAPLLHLGWMALRPLHFSDDAVFFLLVIVCIPAIVGLSYVFHCLFERPFMRVREQRAPAPA